MAPATWLQLTATLICSSWIYCCLRQPDQLLTSWNLIWQDMVFQTDSPHTTTHSSTVLSFKRLQLIISLNILKRLHGIFNATEGLRKVSKFPKIMLENVANASHDPHLSLLDFRNTPSEGMDSTPQQRVFSSRTRSSLPMANHLLQPNSFSIYTWICNKGKTSKRSTSTEVLKSCNH